MAREQLMMHSILKHPMGTHHKNDAAPCRRSSGLSLLEVSAGMVFVTIVLLGLGAVFVSSQRSYEVGLEEAVVTHAFRHTAEDVRGTIFEDIVTVWTNYTFTVDQIGGVGTVTFFLDETSASTDAAQLGLPRDLDGDGSATNTDVSASYVLLPMKIEISWTSPQGSKTRSLYTLLSKEG